MIVQATEDINFGSWVLEKGGVCKLKLVGINPTSFILKPSAFPTGGRRPVWYIYPENADKILAKFKPVLGLEG